MDLSLAKATKALSSTPTDIGVLALCGVCVVGAVSCLAYACSQSKSVPTFEERQQRKQELRDWVENIHIDYGIYQNKKRIFTEREAVEGRRQQIIEDVERLYEAAVVDGHILYRCNSSDVFVAMPKKFLEQKYNIHIEAETYLFQYLRDLLPQRVTIGSQAGIPGIDPRGHPIREPWVWDESFYRSYIDPDNLNLFLSQRCMEMLKLVCDEAGNAAVTNLSYKEIGRSTDFYNMILFKPDLQGKRTDLIALDLPLPSNCGYVGLLSDIGASCNVQFAAYPLSPETPHIRGPQSLVDATHYYDTHACDRFFAYLRARHQNWPAGRRNQVMVEHPEAGSTAGDVIRTYSWMWARRGSSLELSDAIYQLATLLI